MTYTEIVMACALIVVAVLTFVAGFFCGQMWFERKVPSWMCRRCLGGDADCDECSGSLPIKEISRSGRGYG